MDVTDVIGSTGRVQMKALIALLFRPLPGAFVYLAMQISLIELDHWCSPTPSYSNFTSDEWKECCIPRKSSKQLSRCEYYDVEHGQNETSLSCSSWEYDRSLQYGSARADWNLVCNRGWYVSMLYLAFTLGNLVAYVPTGYLADRYGRKPVCMAGLLLAGAAIFGSAFCTSVEEMIVTRFLSGLFYAGTQNPYICLYLECVGQEYRSWVILSFSGAWGLSVVFVAAISYFITNWRILFFLASFPAHLPVLFILWKLIPESARWLLSVKKYDRAEQIITQQTKENGIILRDTKSVMDGLKKKVEMDKDKQGRVTFLDLLKDRDILKATSVLYLALFLTVFVNHGYNLTVGRLGGSLHVNLMINGVVDMVALALFFTLIKYASKKRGLLLTFVGTGVSFLLTLLIGDDLLWLRVLLAMFGRLCNTTSYNLLYVFASEIFPTSLRVVGVSGGMSAGRIGSLLASFADDMGRVFGNSAPITMFGVLSLVTSAVFLVLPELSNRNLPDSLAETRMMASGKGELESTELKSSVEA